MRCLPILFSLALLAQVALGQSQTSLYLNRRVTATNYTVKISDTYIAATATLTNTLPPANTTRSGQAFIVQDVNGNAITVRPSGADTISGIAGDDIVTGQLSGIYVSNGSNGWERPPLIQPTAPVFSNIGAMVASIPPTLYTNTFVMSYATQGDGGGGQFVWNLGSVAATNLCTVFAGTHAGSPSGRWIRQYVGPVQLAWCGAFGNGADELIQLQAAFNVSSNSTQAVQGNPGKTYNTSDTLVLGNSGLDLRLATLKFNLNGNKFALQLQNNSEVRNGTVQVNGSNLSATGGDYHCPIVIGNAFGAMGAPLVGYTNVICHGLTLIVSRTNGAGILVCSDSSNWRIENCYFPSSDRLGAAVSVNAGTDGNNPPLAETHPYDGIIRNIKCGALSCTNGGVGAVNSIIYLSGVYNISVENVYAESIAGNAAIFVTPGDYGFTRANASQKPLAMQGISINNVTVPLCEHIGFYCDGFADNAGVYYSVPIIAQNMHFSGNGSANANSGIQLARGFDMTVANSSVESFKDGIIVDEITRRARLINIQSVSNQQTGLTISASPLPEDITVDGGHYWGNQTGILLDSQLRTVVRGVTLGNTNEPNQTLGIRINTGSQFASLYDNRVIGLKAPGVCYVLIAGGPYYDGIWEFRNNFFPTNTVGLTYRTGLIYVPVSRRPSAGNTVNTDLITANPGPPTDFAASQGDTVRMELPDVSPTNYVAQRWYCTASGTPGGWTVDPLLYNVVDSHPELVIGKRVRMLGEVAFLPAPPQLLVSTSIISTATWNIPIQGASGPVTLTSIGMADNFEGEKITLWGSDQTALVTLQDYRVNTNSNIKLISQTTKIIPYATPVDFTFDPLSSLWAEHDSGSTGTVTSVALSMPTGFSVGGSPVTGAGTLAVTTALNGIVNGNGSAFGTVTIGSGLSYDGTTLANTGGSGTLTNFSVGNLSALFTVSAPTTFPLLASTSPAGNRIWGFDFTDSAPALMSLGTGASYDHATHTWSFSGGGGGGATNAYSIISDNGSAVSARTNLNFNHGASISIADNAGAQRTDLTIDSDLDALAGNTSNGLWARTGTGTGAARTLQPPSFGFTISSPDGVSGNPTFALANDLAAVEALNTTGIAVRTGSETWATRTLTATDGVSVSNGNGASGNPALSMDIAGLSSTTTVDPLNDYVPILIAPGNRKVHPADLMGGSGLKNVYRTKALVVNGNTSILRLTPSGNLTGFGVNLQGAVLAKTATRQSILNVTLFITCQRTDATGGVVGSAALVVNENGNQPAGQLFFDDAGGTYTGATSCDVQVGAFTDGSWFPTSIVWYFFTDQFGPGTVTFL